MPNTPANRSASGSSTPYTQTNPNLNFDQYIPGRNDGRSYGIIETRGLIGIVDAVGQFEYSESWTVQNTEGMKAWFRNYLTWLQTSQIGQKASSAQINMAPGTTSMS